MMTQIIVLAGLVAAEKAALAVDLAHHYMAGGRQAAILDNIARVGIPAEDVPAGVAYQRIPADLSDGLAAHVAAAHADVVIVAASEQIHPEALMLAVDALPAANDVQTWALIDTRTCDCFPQVRLLLEDYADAVYHVPVTIEEILG